MTIADYIEAVAAVGGEKKEAARMHMIAASFTAWQMLQVQVKKLPSWGEYMKRLKLTDRTDTMSAVARQRIIDNAIEIHSQIMAARGK